MTKQIVVITDHRDLHVPFIQAHLESPLHIVDPHTLLRGSRLSYELAGAGIAVTHNGVRLGQVASVWYRKPQPIHASEVPVPVGYQAYAGRALQAHANLLRTAFRTARWVSDYYAVLRAESKALQLETAAKLGFRVPATLITSDTNAARQFINQQEAVMVKPLSFNSPFINGKPKMFFATLLDKKVPPDLRKLHLAPAIFQQAIAAVVDIRVTVVGNKVFAAAIRSKKSGASSQVRDWRLDHFTDNAEIIKYTLPEEIAELCLSHVKSLGLLFGAIDLVMDKKGKLWFLENNPNGQWAFVEEATGQPIGKALAQLLMRS